MRNVCVIFCSMVIFGCSSIVGEGGQGEEEGSDTQSESEGESDSFSGEDSDSEVDETDESSITLTDSNSVDTDSNTEDGSNTEDTSTGDSDSILEGLCKNIDENTYIVNYSSGGTQDFLVFDESSGEYISTGVKTTDIGNWESDFKYSFFHFSMSAITQKSLALYSHTYVSGNEAKCSSSDLFSLNLGEFGFSSLEFNCDSLFKIPTSGVNFTLYYGHGREDVVVFGENSVDNESYLSVYDSSDFSSPVETCSGVGGMEFWGGASGKLYYSKIEYEGQKVSVIVGEFNLGTCSIGTQVNLSTIPSAEEITKFYVMNEQFILEARDSACGDCHRKYYFDISGNLVSTESVPKAFGVTVVSPCFS